MASPAAAATIKFRFISISFQTTKREGGHFTGPPWAEHGVDDDYGTVGTWPAFSCASRAALSVAS